MNTTLIKSLTLCLIASFLTACGQPKLDTSSPEAIKASIAEMQASMTPEEAEAFEENVSGLLSMAGFACFMAPKDTEATCQQAAEESINEELDGKTAADINQMVEQMVEEIKEGFKND